MPHRNHPAARPLRSLYLTLAALVSASCVPTTPATSPQAVARVAADTTPHVRPATFSDIRAEVAPLDESSALPSALHIAELRTTALPARDRELRVWSGLVVGYPHSGLVLRVHGDAIEGTLVRYWPVNDTAFADAPAEGEDALDSEALYAWHEAGRCGPLDRGEDAVACVVQLRRQPDWRALLAALDSAHAWTLPDESELPRHGLVIDGWRLRVEARQGDSYRRYQYANPNALPLPEGKAATYVGWLVDSLMLHYARPSAAYRRFRGQLALGRDTSDFTACGEKAPVYMGGDFRRVIALVADSTWQRRGTPAHRFYVEGWGTLGPERRQRRGSRVYSRSWAVDTITTVRESGPGGCER